MKAVRVVRHGRRDRAAAQSEPRHVAEPDTAGLPVSFEDRDPGDVDRGIARVEHERSGGQAPGLDADDARMTRRRRFEGELRGGRPVLQVH